MLSIQMCYEPNTTLKKVFFFFVNEQILRDLVVNNNWTKVYVIGVLEREERERQKINLNKNGYNISKLDETCKFTESGC